MRSSFYTGPIQMQLQLLLILKSPHLVRIIWECSQQDTAERPLALLASAVRSGQFSGERQVRLISLGLGKSDFQLLDFQCLLESLTGLKELDLNRTNFNRSSWNAMRERGPQLRRMLTVLNLGDCSQMDGALVHEILCEMPSLEIFKADHVMEDNLIQDPRPWACEELRELSVALVDDRRRVGVENEEQRWPQSRLVRQLSALHQLQVLDFQMGNNRLLRDEEILPIKLTLGNGGCLDQLRSLRWMRCFWAPGYSQQINWGEAEVQWVMKHWIRLQKWANVFEDYDEDPLTMAYLNE
ncbi:hypothetical protein EMPS_08468 [Entomortierella parvispora]|uniref:Uncharacterized protein n=1 Tax=Entomortierella parvispora TaxID=205924 RepID=A0A9P3HG65_9FUNG|nr:hypothetical protein EMPS_08468 [Entomortierella parvispora]